MMKITQFIRNLFSFLFFFHALAISWNISPGSLAGKLQREPPAWMWQRIEHDFSCFQKGLSSIEIASCLQSLQEMQGIEMAGLVHLRFTNGMASYEPLFPLTLEHTQAFF